METTKGKQRWDVLECHALLLGYVDCFRNCLIGNCNYDNAGVYQPSPFCSLHIHKQNLRFSMTLVPAAEDAPECIDLIIRIPTRWVPM